MSLNNIKSSYFTFMLFSYLNEGTKLKIVLYNKRLQKLLDINLINFKIFSGRYVELQQNGEWKELSSYDDYLIFERQYLNGKRNGKEIFYLKENI